MVSSILNKVQVEKDEGPEAKALLRILIVAEGPCQICSFLYFYFFHCYFGPNWFEGPCLFLLFCSDTLYVLILFSIQWLLAFDKIVRNFLWVPRWTNLRLIEVILVASTWSGIIQNSVTCIKRYIPSKDHIIWYQSFGSCYRFYPIQFLFLFFSL